MTEIQEQVLICPDCQAGRPCKDNERLLRAEIERLKAAMAEQTARWIEQDANVAAVIAENGRLRHSARVRDARVEKPPDELVLAWSDGFWVPTLGSYSPCGQTFVWWLPMPPAPEVKP